MNAVAITQNRTSFGRRTIKACEKALRAAGLGVVVCYPTDSIELEVPAAQLEQAQEVIRKARPKK